MRRGEGGCHGWRCRLKFHSSSEYKGWEPNGLYIQTSNQPKYLCWNRGLSPVEWGIEYTPKGSSKKGVDRGGLSPIGG